MGGLILQGLLDGTLITQGYSTGDAAEATCIVIQGLLQGTMITQGYGVIPVITVYDDGGDLGWPIAGARQQEADMRHRREDVIAAALMMLAE